MEKLYTVSIKILGADWLRSWTPYCQIQTEIEESRENHKTIQVWPRSNPLWLYRRSDKLIQGIRSDRQRAWRTMDRDLWHCTEGSDQDSPQEKEKQKGKMVVCRGLINSWEKKRSKGQRKERHSHLNAEFQRIARRDKKAFLNDQCKEIEENSTMGKTRDLFKKIRYQGNISCKDENNKGQKWYGPKRSKR